MTTVTLNEILEKGAWSKISSSRKLSLDMLEQYSDKLDWKEISRNGSIPWTVDALQKFADRIDWDEFSERCPEHLISTLFLQKFCDRWNWARLSQHYVFRYNRSNNYNDSVFFEMLWDLLEKFADKVNWGELINFGYNIFSNPQAFFERFQQYIPMNELMSSSLWERMASERAEALWLEMGGEKTVGF